MIVFMPSGRRGRFPIGTPLLTAARSLGVDIDSVCGGRGLCGRCQVSVSVGNFPKLGIGSVEANLVGSGELEARVAARGRLIDGRRLSCSASILGDVVIDVPAESQLHRQVVRKRADARTISIDPVVRLHYIELDSPTMEDPSSDCARVECALEAEWGLKRLGWAHSARQSLAQILRDGAWKVTVAVREADCVIAVWPGFHDRTFGLAVDVGTTTIAAHLCNLASGEVVAALGAMNPQIRFGEDVMSRISYLQLNPDRAADPTAAVRATIDELATAATAKAGIDPTEIVEATVVGNPTMHHMLLGLDSRQLGSAPFPLVTQSAVTVRAHDLDIAVHEGAMVYALPCIAGHIGADTAGVILSEAPHLDDALTLIIDIGTNAEIVLGNRQRLLACSCPTGPAFEGAQISCGQRAAPGAIERVRIDRDTLVPRFKVVGCDMWSDDAEFADATADTGVTGICGSGIVEAVAEMYLAGILTADGLVDGACAACSRHVVPNGKSFAYRLQDGTDALCVTQHDVRAIQLAKAALAAGTRLLLERFDDAPAPDRIVLTGAFGSYIDVEYAMALGMLPAGDPSTVSIAGNAAGTGARIALLNRAARAEIEAIVRRVERVEIAADRRFQDYFVAAMAIPEAAATPSDFGRTECQLRCGTEEESQR
jgi:uncharacterized 2Fe-2S/4Fe-4S cluster protein (DUF4445 family)